MNEDNIHSVKQIEDECFSNPWSFESLNAELSKVGACFYVAQSENDALGYIGFNMVLDEGYIANLAVKKIYRRQQCSLPPPRNLRRYFLQRREDRSHGQGEIRGYRRA